MARTFLTSDLHLGHENIIEYSERPFDSLAEMHETITHQWNAVVSSEDTVFVLGDVAMGDRQKELSQLLRLNGKKILINGNHDRCSPVNNRSWEHQHDYLFDSHGNRLFSAVMDHTVISLPALSRKLPNKKVMASHYPYVGDHTDRPHLDKFRLRDEGQWLVHGHIHESGWLQRSPKSGTVMFNVGVDVNGFAPIEARHAHELMKAFEKSGDQSWDAPADQFKKVKQL